MYVPIPVCSVLEQFCSSGLSMVLQLFQMMQLKYTLKKWKTASQQNYTEYVYGCIVQYNIVQFM